MKVFQNTETLPVLVMNYLQGLEEKWYRASTSILFTSLRTETDICLKPRFTRVSCRKRTDTVVPRAGNFGDLITADHKVLSEGCESGNNHRYAVVVQDLVTQWIQSHPCKTITSKKPQRAYKISWCRQVNLKSFTLTIL